MLTYACRISRKLDKRGHVFPQNCRHLRVNEVWMHTWQSGPSMRKWKNKLSGPITAEEMWRYRKCVGKCTSKATGKRRIPNRQRLIFPLTSVSASYSYYIWVTGTFCIVFKGICVTPLLFIIVVQNYVVAVNQHASERREVPNVDTATRGPNWQEQNENLEVICPAQKYTWK